MVRKTSDMVLLLGSRGRVGGRRSSKFVDAVSGIVGTLFGHTSLRRREDGRRRAGSVPAWLALAVALACFIGGFLTGDHLGQAKGAKAGADALHASGRTPQLLDEADTSRLSQEAFIVSVYPNLDPVVAKGKARALSDHLVGKQLEKARPLWWTFGPAPLWVVAVYFDGPAELVVTKNRLLALQDVPDEAFVHLRNNQVGWPEPWPIK